MPVVASSDQKEQQRVIWTGCTWLHCFFVAEHPSNMKCVSQGRICFLNCACCKFILLDQTYSEVWSQTQAKLETLVEIRTLQHLFVQLTSLRYMKHYYLNPLRNVLLATFCKSCIGFHRHHVNIRVKTLSQVSCLQWKWTLQKRSFFFEKQKVQILCCPLLGHGLVSCSFVCLFAH